MSTTSARPLPVTLVAVWGALAGVVNVGLAVLLGLLTVFNPFFVFVPLLWLAGAIALLVVAVGLYRVAGWARLAGLALFGLFATVEQLYLFAGTDLPMTLLRFALHAASFGVLVVYDGPYWRGRSTF